MRLAASLIAGGGAMDVVHAEQADHPVAQILALQEHEDDEHEHDAGRGDRLHQGPDEGRKRLQRRRRRLVDLDRDRSRAAASAAQADWALPAQPRLPGGPP